MTWINIEGYEGLYQINEDGQIRSVKTDKIRKVNYCGEYPFILLSKNGIKKQHKMHLLIGKYFVPNPDNKPEVNHKNGNKHDFSKGNLEWCTHPENMKNSYKMGMHKPTTIQQRMIYADLKRKGLIGKRIWRKVYKQTA